MIGRLTGQVAGRAETHALIDVGGVGYLVEGSGRMLAALPADGETITLAIETYIREDQFRLFGFISEEERGWFRLLLGVQGVGARVALAIQSVLSGAELAQAIAMEDKAMITQAPGVGAKVATRIVQELANKIPEGQVMEVSGAASAGAGVSVSAPQEAISALLNLGYARATAQQAVQAAAKDNADADTQTLIKQALKELASA